MLYFNWSSIYIFAPKQTVIGWACRPTWWWYLYWRRNWKHPGPVLCHETVQNSHLHSFHIRIRNYSLQINSSSAWAVVGQSTGSNFRNRCMRMMNASTSSTNFHFTVAFFLFSEELWKICVWISWTHPQTLRLLEYTLESISTWLSMVCRADIQALSVHFWQVIR